MFLHVKYNIVIEGRMTMSVIEILIFCRKNHNFYYFLNHNLRVETR